MLCPVDPSFTLFVDKKKKIVVVVVVVKPRKRIMVDRFREGRQVEGRVGRRGPDGWLDPQYGATKLLL